MIKTTTQNDVLRYIFNETNCGEKQEIEESLAIDQELQEFHMSSLMVLTQMQKMDKVASERSVCNIMAYARMRSSA